jgi:type IV pilus assembly protein PilF
MRPEAHLVIVFLALSLAACGTTTPRATTSAPGSAPSAAEVQVGLAQGYLRQGRLDIAMDRANRALALEPRLPAAHTVAAIIYQRVGDDESAGRHYARAVELAPRSGDALNNYGTFLCGRQDFDRADALFERAAKDPFYRTPAVALANRGSCAVKAGRFDDGEGWLRAALEIDPNHGDALFALAGLSQARGDDLRSRAFIERYLAASAASPEALVMAIGIEERLGNRRAAEEYRSRLRREFPDSAAATAQDGKTP